MPIADYTCPECGASREQLFNAAEWRLVLDGKLHVRCPECDCPAMSRRTAASGFHLKGDGWAKDGYS